MKNYYHVLNLQRNAPPEAVKEAYRKLSKKMHPDLNGGDRYFEEFFKEVQQAYEVLSNPTKRQTHNWELDNQGGAEPSKQRNVRDQESVQEYERKLQQWFEELSKRQQEVFDLRLAEMQRRYEAKEKRLNEQEIDWKRRVRQSTLEARNLWIGASIIVLILLVLAGLAWSARSRAERDIKALQDAPPALPQGWQLISDADKDKYKRESSERDFWRGMALHEALPVGGGSHFVTAIYYMPGADTLDRVGKWRSEWLIDFLLYQTAACPDLQIELTAYASAHELSPVQPDDKDARLLPLASRRGNHFYQLLQLNGISSEGIRFQSQVEPCPRPDDRAWCAGQGRVEVRVRRR